jgi:hypothetical protein
VDISEGKLYYPRIKGFGQGKGIPIFEKMAKKKYDAFK